LTLLQVPARLIQQLQDQIQFSLDAAHFAPYEELGDADVETLAVWFLEDTVAKLLPGVLNSVFQSVHDDFVIQHTESGTTATVVVVCGHEVLSANVGDSLAYLDTGCQVLLLSGNHRIDENDAERKRLVDAGGDIGQAELNGEAVGPLRVWPGGLAFSRYALPASPAKICEGLQINFHGTTLRTLTISAVCERTQQFPGTAAFLMVVTPFQKTLCHH
jgi:hypothetical protein